MNLSVTHAWRKGNFKSVFRINYTEMLINFIVLFYQSITYNQTRNTVRDELQVAVVKYQDLKPHLHTQATFFQRDSTIFYA